MKIIEIIMVRNLFYSLGMSQHRNSCCERPLLMLATDITAGIHIAGVDFLCFVYYFGFCISNGEVLERRQGQIFLS